MTPLQIIKQPIEKEFELFQHLFAQSFETDNPLLKEVLNYVYAKKGKQMRPIVLLLAAKICGDVSHTTLLSAISYELLHTASLIHDDVVDLTIQRRGQASVNAHWNNKVAVLAGDYMLSNSLAKATETNNLRLLQIIANIGKELASGELLQLSNAHGAWLNEADYFKVIEQKTAQLFAGCTEAGAVSVNATEEETAHLREFGRLLGMCFQLKDDLLDYSDSTEIGKPTMNDVRDGKITLPLIKAIQNAPLTEQQNIENLIHSTDFSDENLELIRQFVIKYKGIEDTFEVIEEQKNQALKTLDFFTNSAAKNSLIGILSYAINRTK